MPILIAAGNTIYTRPVAKVMISIPDPLLVRLDALSESAGETRSGTIQRLAEAELAEDESRRKQEMIELLGSIDIDLGGKSAAQLIREDRESH